ncbi:MAG: hypothetical protein U5K70_06260 [Halodesulfurarchaeum sp.]|nr:hypothetical protein [Halodesulfurarchaeum sp.]
MVDRWQNVAGVCALVGGGLVVVSSIPPAWYGVEPTDSYLFDPAVFSPLWTERMLMPLLSLGALVGLLVGVGALVYRDWSVSRTLRVGGSLAVLGGTTLAVGLYGPEFVSPAGTPVGPVAGIAGFALLVWGGLLLLVGGPLLAYSYLRAGRRWLAGTILGVVPMMLLIGSLFPGGIADLGSSIPAFVLGVVIARDLVLREPAGRDMGTV